MAVLLLGSLVDPSHEIAIRERFAERLPGLPCSCSHEVSPEIRGFERTSTTVLNVLLMPVVQRYVAGLLARTRQARPAAPLYLVQSHCGAASPAQAGPAHVNLLLSGPSGGVLAAEKVAAAAAGRDNIMAVDMGGALAIDLAGAQAALDRLIAGPLCLRPAVMPCAAAARRRASQSPHDPIRCRGPARQMASRGHRALSCGSA